MDSQESPLYIGTQYKICFKSGLTLEERLVSCRTCIGLSDSNGAPRCHHPKGGKGVVARTTLPRVRTPRAWGCPQETGSAQTMGHVL